MACEEYPGVRSDIGKLQQKTLDTCRNLDSLRVEVGKMDSRINKRIGETVDTINRRIDDKMDSIRRLFWIIMSSIFVSGGGFVLFIMHLYDKIEKLLH